MSTSLKFPFCSKKEESYSRDTLPLNTAPTELRDSAFSSPWKNNFAGFPWIKKRFHLILRVLEVDTPVTSLKGLCLKFKDECQSNDFFLRSFPGDFPIGGGNNASKTQCVSS
ncbi:uncharacterized protein LOC141881470 isoform X4 [Acropora palmata]|uniref:uncharacterized protein LOC141881470 isoform X4 n=1 Tax=Acropora palmata TaxID=6131 RepID=UPI003DA15FDF